MGEVRNASAQEVALVVLGQDDQLSRRELRFRNPTLSGYVWPLLALEGSEPGPRLCVMAGLHVNEVSSMEAALRLARLLNGAVLRGRIEIIPVVNVAALWDRVVQVCPVDGQNINFAFPGDPGGSFTPALAFALLNEWARDADLLIDLHGGDLQTQIAKFVMCQMTGDEAFDERTRRFASCFDADILVEFEAGQTENAGRACNARPALGHHAVMAEGGANGLIEETAVRFHTDGVINCAAVLGLIAERPIVAFRDQVRVSGFDLMAAPLSGRFYPKVGVGETVQEGQIVGIMRDIYGDVVAQMRTPRAGIVVYRYSHPVVTEGESVLAIGRPL